MKKALHIAKASIRKHISASASLFAIVMAMSALCAIGLSLALGVARDYEEGVDRLNSLHSVFIMAKDMYEPSFERIIRDDPRVTEYEIGEAVYASQMKLAYGGDIEHRVIILNADAYADTYADAYAGTGTGVGADAADAGRKISAPKITVQDGSVPREAAVYLPTYAQRLGFAAGSPFYITYRNKPITLTVAGFFESSEFVLSNGMALKLFAAGECYEGLKRQIGSSVWIPIRFMDPYDSTSFNEDFRAQIDIELVAPFSDDSFVLDFAGSSENAIVPIMILTAIILLFALIVALIAMLVTRFRVSNGIEDSMRSIGVLKASGYTSGQIIAGYMVEYGMLALPAALAGVFLAVPVFPAVRQALESVSGNAWTLGANMPAGLAAAALIAAALLLMVLLSCRRIKELPPVVALRGETVPDGPRRNSFPLHKGAGGVDMRLGLKSAAAYSKRYAMAGAVLAAATYAIIVIAAMYQNFVMDTAALIRMVGIETSDVDLTVARHTDADALAEELERLPEVRKTSMLDWLMFQIDGVDVMGFASNDYGRMETMAAHDGRFPDDGGEIALPKILADQLGKKLGDSVIVKANGVEQEYTVCGHFSSANNGGRMGAVTLEGYHRLDPYYQRGNIKVYLNDGVAFGAFSELLKANFGVVNVYGQDGNGRFAAAKAHAEEKIANYLEFYGIDSVDYAVVYNGEIILSGSSGAYRIEKITDYNAWMDSHVGVYGSAVKLLTQAVSFVSLGIIALMLAMTVRQIIAKRRRELGILKSGGFTTKQLARQIAISFLPCSALGALAGCVGGALSVNPAITAMFVSSGVYNADVHIYPPVAAAIGAMALLFALAVAYLSAMGIERITAYELLAE